MFKYILALIVFLFLAPKNVYAYLDPGSGSYLVQVVLGVVFGGLFMIKIYWNKIKSIFIKKSSKKTHDETSKK